MGLDLDLVHRPHRLGELGLGLRLDRAGPDGGINNCVRLAPHAGLGLARRDVFGRWRPGAFSLPVLDELAIIRGIVAEVARASGQVSVILDRLAQNALQGSAQLGCAIQLVGDEAELVVAGLSHQARVADKVVQPRPPGIGAGEGGLDEGAIPVQQGCLNQVAHPLAQAGRPQLIHQLRLDLDGRPAVQDCEAHRLLQVRHVHEVNRPVQRRLEILQQVPPRLPRRGPEVASRHRRGRPWAERRRRGLGRLGDRLGGALEPLALRHNQFVKVLAEVVEDREDVRWTKIVPSRRLH